MHTTYTVNEIKQRNKDVLLMHGSFNHDSDPVQVTNSKEYYKNGNIKAYTSFLKIHEPYKTESVRNRNYSLYSENLDIAYTYLELIFYSKAYEKNIQEYYKVLGREHIYGFDSSISFMNMRNEVLEPLKLHKIPEPTYKEMDDLKPSLNDSRFQYDISLLGKILLYGFVIKGFKKQKFNRALNRYYKQLENADKNKRNYFDRVYPLKKENRSIDNQINQIKEKYSRIWKGYESFSEESDVQKYFDIMFDKYFDPEIPYAGCDHSVTFDMKSNALIVDCEIPSEYDLPRIKTLKPIKKHGHSRVTFFSKNEFKEKYEKAVSSHILYLLTLLYKIDSFDLIDKVFVNVYEFSYKDDDLEGCIFVCEAPMSQIEPNWFKTDSAVSMLYRVTVQYFDMDSDDKDPIRKRRG